MRPRTQCLLSARARADGRDTQWTMGKCGDHIEPAGGVVLSLRLVIASLVMATLLSGCRTISTVPRRQVVEGEEIAGSQRYELQIAGVERTSAGPHDRIVIKGDGAMRQCGVERTEKSWDVITRERSLFVAGVHPQYSLATDCSMDLVLGAACILGSPLFVVVVFMPSDEPDGPNFGQRCSALGSMVGGAAVGLLPCINWGEPTTETISSNEKRRELEPIRKVREARLEDVRGLTIDWRVTRDAGAELGRGQLVWPEAVDLPMCKWAVENPKERALTLTLSSAVMDLKGQLEFKLPIDVVAAARRQWPDATKAPTVQLSVASTMIVGEDDLPLDVLMAGKTARLRVSVLNAPSASGQAYAVRPVVEGSDDLVRVHDAGQIPLLSQGETATVDVLLSVPPFALDNQAAIRVGIRDELGRMSKEVNVQLSIRHAELPALRISVAKLWTVPTSRSTHELEVVVRNAGLAAAGGVTIALNELPPGCRWIDSRRNVGEIRALETRSVRIPLRMDSASGVVPFNIEVRESTGLYPVSRHIDVPVMPP